MDGCISQAYFDELCIENYEVFEFICKEDALAETITQLNGQNLAHLSLTYPDESDATASQIRSQIQHVQSALRTLDAVQTIEEVDTGMQALTTIAQTFQLDQECRGLFLHLFLVENGFFVYSKLLSRMAAHSQGDAMETILTTLLEFSSESTKLTSAFQTAIPIAMPALLAVYEETLDRPNWSEMTIATRILSAVSLSVSRSEVNKTLWMKTYTETGTFASILLRTIQLATDATNQAAPTRAACTVCTILTALCTFDDFKANQETSMPVVQSGHANVQILADAGALTVVHDLLRYMETQNLGDIAVVVSTLRAMSIQDNIVKALENNHVIETASRLLETTILASDRMRQQQVVTALLGLFRNAAANDDVKTTLCVGTNRAVMKNAIQAMRVYPLVPLLQEHACGLVAAVALRKPNHASVLVELGVHGLIVAAMEEYPHCSTLQRQAALALRNLAARSPELRATILEGSTEEALRTIAAKHFSCQDEVYAALRDLGLSAPSVHIHQSDDGEVTIQKGRQMFGVRNPHFRPVYDE